MISLLSATHDFAPLDDDLHLFNEGSPPPLLRAPGRAPKPGGTQFAVWAPNAKMVVVGWKRRKQAPGRPAPRGKSGILGGILKGIGKGTKYKFHIEGRRVSGDKADPSPSMRRRAAHRLARLDLDLQMGHAKWMEEGGPAQRLDGPSPFYENGTSRSWRRLPEEGTARSNYRRAGERSRDYLKRLGFTHARVPARHVHPFYGSWGYQTDGLLRSHQLGTGAPGFHVT